MNINKIASKIAAESESESESESTEPERSTDAQKMEAIKYLLQYGMRGSEWQEAGLLNAIQGVMNGEIGTDKKALDASIAEAAEY
jgi:hypothetical protein